MKTSGRMEARSYLEMARDILCYPHWAPNLSGIFDHRALQFSDVPQGDLDEIRAFCWENEEGIGSGKTAIIVKTGEVDAWHALWPKGEKIVTANRVRAFDDYTEGLDWVLT